MAPRPRYVLCVSEQVADDERYMRAALTEAQKARGQTSPNPMVGAVLVIAGEIVAKGHHRRAGEAHAEVNCLHAFNKAVPPDATLYVTLEPCSTTGRTPRCTEVIVGAGVKQVVIGAIDPNPRHCGRAVEILQAADVNVRSGVLAGECARLNDGFNKWVRTRRPLVVVKCGMSLDGRLTTAPGETRWITSPAARRHANRFRAEVDAILIGAETLRTDDPLLTVREVKGARQPWRIVLTRSGRLPESAHVFNDAFAARTLVFRGQELADVLDELGRREVTSVLIEGGGDILGQAVDRRLIDKVRIYIGSVFTGGPVVAFAGTGAGSTGEAMTLRDVRYEKIGNDIFVAAGAQYQSASPE